MARFPILMPVKRAGKLHPVNTELDFEDHELASLKELGVIDADQTPGDDPEAELDLKASLASLIAAGHDIKSMTVSNIHTLLGANARGVKRRDIDAVLKEIEAETKDD